jgi:hypothetical protein
MHDIDQLLSGNRERPPVLEVDMPAIPIGATMKFVRVTGAAAAFLFFGTILPASAQHDGKEGDKQDEKQGKPAKSQGKQSKGTQPRQKSAPQAKRQQEPQRQQKGSQPQQAQRPGQPQQQHQRAQQPRQPPQQRGPQQAQPQQARKQPPPQRTRQQAQAWQQQRGWLQKGGWQPHDTWQQDRAQHWSSDHRTWAQRGGYGGYHVPRAQFSLYFGSQHVFRIRSRPVMYQGFPRFEYSGLSFLLVDPWPEYWSEDWYASDDVYIDYDDGYYLYNRRDPQVRLAVMISL